MYHVRTNSDSILVENLRHNQQLLSLNLGSNFQVLKLYFCNFAHPTQRSYFKKKKKKHPFYLFWSFPMALLVAPFEAFFFFFLILRVAYA